MSALFATGMLLSSTAVVTAQETSSPPKASSASWVCYDGTEGKESGEQTPDAYRKIATDFCAGLCSDETGKCGLNTFRLGPPVAQPGFNKPMMDRPIALNCAELLKKLSALNSDSKEYATYKDRLRALGCDASASRSPVQDSLVRTLPVMQPMATNCESLKKVYDEMIATLTIENKEAWSKRLEDIKARLVRCENQEVSEEKKPESKDEFVPCRKGPDGVITCADGTSVQANGDVQCRLPMPMLIDREMEDVQVKTEETDANGCTVKTFENGMVLKHCSKEVWKEGTSTPVVQGTVKVTPPTRSNERVKQRMVRRRVLQQKKIPAPTTTPVTE